MAESTGIVLTVGAVTAANELLFAPLVPGGVKASFNWRIIPATAVLAFTLAGLEKLTPGFAVGLAWLSLLTAATQSFGNAASPVDNLLKILGYQK